ncbi:hypothetical protein CHU98_g8859 [Xylaria longipes]|nr:hypothetical protein CHU98_g8859 [Xylaria longipes]
MPAGCFECPTDIKLLDDEVCYGALHDAMAKGLSNTRMSDSPVIKAPDPFTCFRVQTKDHIYVLCYESGSEFAVLDTRTTSRLSALSETPMLRFEAVVESSIFSKRQRGGKPRPRIFPLSVNIFGSMTTADDVACRLSKVSTFLQHPQSLHEEVEYHNPQLLTFANDDSNMRDLVGIGNNSIWALNINVVGEVGRILESLTHTDIVALYYNELIALKEETRHQEGGVRFILQREEEAFSQQLSAQLRQVIGIQIDSPLSMCFGGLIADVMGLGKTLTMLTAILQSMSVAEEFGNFYERSDDELMEKIRTKATLSSSTLGYRRYKHALNFVCFHGQDRPRDSETLRSASLVLTTYATLAADYAGQCTLDKMEWYRVVLDEAHWIRNSSSKQFRAAASLHARSRWCLTGTPIQNKLDDITSLAQFLRLSPLSTRMAFQKHILGPLSEGGLNFAKPLRGYLEAYCLRRSEKCLTLPPSGQKNVTLQLSSEERQLYNQILNNTRRQIDSLVSKRDNGTYSRLFTAMLRMRMLCNLGTFSWVGTSKAPLRRRHLDIGCERCSATDEDTLMLLGDCSFCPDCQRPLSPSSPLPDSTDDQRSVAETSRGDTDIILDKMTGDLTVPGGPFLRHGSSTKLNAVVQNIACSGADDKRSKALKAFKEDPEVLVLLMSIETGAVGLNLTVANRVHIVEPQWNPSVEDQAIARALRMGQTREVMIIRYIVENTVEQNIINLQQKKKRLAKFTFDTGTETPPDMLEDLRLMFDMGSK